MSDHTSKNFDLELEKLAPRVLEMGGMAEQQVRKAIEGLYNNDRPLLEGVNATTGSTRWKSKSTPCATRSSPNASPLPSTCE